MEGNKVVFLVLLCFIGGIKKCHLETSTCNPQSCKNSPCSTNVDCECLSLTTNPTAGVCAALVLSCTSLVRCNSENRACPIENTVCVNNTRCQYPVCYPLALADKQVCPSSLLATTTHPTITPEPIVSLCPVGQIPLITADGNEQVNFRTRFPVCPSCVNISINANGGMYNVCSTGQLNIVANANGDVIMQDSTACPKFVNISVNGNSDIYNVCSSIQLNVTTNGNNDVIIKQSSVCPSYVNLTVNSNGKVYNVCSSEQLYITANGNGAVTMQKSLICPKLVNISAGGNGRAYNICVTEQLNILSASGNNIISLENHQSTICPKFANISIGGNAKVYNICVTDQLTIFSATGNNIISMDYKDMSSCPKIVNIINGSGISTFYVCATQAINAKLSSITTLYYKGPLNHTELSGLASVKQWI